VTTADMLRFNGEEVFDQNALKLLVVMDAARVVSLLMN
jgi:hypothetical protein